MRLGRYGIRCALVLERLTWEETSGEVACRARAGHRDGRENSVARWNILEFLARVLDHVPEPGEQLLRYRGSYSNAARGMFVAEAAIVVNPCPSRGSLLASGSRRTATGSL